MGLIGIISIFGTLLGGIVTLLMIVVCINEKRNKTIIVALISSIIITLISAYGVKHSMEKEDASRASAWKYNYEHRFDNDVYVLSGREDISNQIQDYLNHGYELQGGSSIQMHGNMCQTVIRKKK